MEMKVSAETLTRTIFLVVSLINNVLLLAGKEVLPFVENDIYQAVSMVMTIVAALLAWWKNNSFTPAAIQADEVLKSLKGK